MKRFDKNVMKKSSYQKTFWKEIGDDFAVICLPNLDLLASLILLAKGNRSMERFAYECQVATSSLYTVLNGKRKRNLSYRTIASIHKHAAPGSGVTMAMLRAANGMSGKLETNEMRKDIESNMKKAQKFVKGFNEAVPENNKTRGQSSLVTPEFISEYEMFVWDLNFFLYHLPKEKAMGILCRRTELFEDKSFVQAVNRFHTLAEDEKEEHMAMLYNFAKTGVWKEEEFRGSECFRKILEDYFKEEENS